MGGAALHLFGICAGAEAVTFNFDNQAVDAVVIEDQRAECVAAVAADSQGLSRLDVGELLGGF